jgi:hypothetical protein
MTSTTRFQLRRTLAVAGLSLLGICASGISHAQSWPSKPIRIVLDLLPAEQPMPWRGWLLKA